MISWVVATNNRTVLEANLLATLKLTDEDELVVVELAASIAEAYAEGQARATQPVRCYVHHDVQVLDNQRLRDELLRWCVPPIGVVGVVGSRNAVVPWWTGACLGSVNDSRTGVQHFSRGGEAAHLDGLLLASAYQLDWDLSIPGWHLYDHDICRQSTALGRVNWCLDNGADLVLHNCSTDFGVVESATWKTGLARYLEKWGT